MDELSPKAEAKDMELVATRGEDEQGSGWSFRRPIGGNETKRTLRGRLGVLRGKIIRERPSPADLRP